MENGVQRHGYISSSAPRRTSASVRFVAAERLKKAVSPLCTVTQDVKNSDQIEVVSEESPHS